MKQMTNLELKLMAVDLEETAYQVYKGVYLDSDYLSMLLKTSALVIQQLSDTVDMLNENSISQTQTNQALINKIYQLQGEK